MNGFQRSIVDSAMDQDDKLTAYECDFITDMDDKGDDYVLSDNQNHLLNEIAQKLD